MKFGPVQNNYVAPNLAQLQQEFTFLTKHIELDQVGPAQKSCQRASMLLGVLQFLHLHVEIHLKSLLN